MTFFDYANVNLFDLLITSHEILKILPEESSFTVIDPDDTKNFLTELSCSTTDNTPGFKTAKVGTWLGRIPNAPENDGTSTCFTFALL